LSTSKVLYPWERIYISQLIVNTVSRFLHIDPPAFKKMVREIGDGARDVNGMSIFRVKNAMHGLLEGAGHRLSPHVGVGGGDWSPQARNLTCGGLVPPDRHLIACRYRQLVPPPKKSRMVGSPLTDGFMQHLSNTMFWMAIIALAFLAVFILIRSGCVCLVLEWLLHSFCCCQAMKICSRRPEGRHRGRSPTVDYQRAPERVTTRNPIYTIPTQPTYASEEPLIWLNFGNGYQALLDTGAAVTIMDKRVIQN